MIPPRSLDRIDLRILETLQLDARISNVDLALKVAVSASPCMRRIRALEESGVIAGYHAHLDPAALGYGITAFVEVRISHHSDQTAANFIAAMNAEPLVAGCYMVTGAYDFLLKIVALDLPSYRDFTIAKLLALPDVEDIRSSLVLDVAKETTALPVPEALVKQG